MDITRAKELLTGLADGVNPLTGELLPDDCICNQAEIVRALHVILSELSPQAKKERSLPANAGKPWTEIEENKLADEFDLGMKLSVIAKEHSRTRGAIEGRLFRMGRIERK
ncbi:hypothetical protein [Marasmitruncus massiliensis]|uniref:hypothetical protein n=1 Tax=Marasmitruncus massiliensis TaxID=1944642 RepID=UPI000C7D0F79|nr:hypothetical protein [Marasmitruncus massiliensis]